MADDNPIELTELEYVLLRFPEYLPSDTSPLWKHEIPEGEQVEGDKLQAILSQAWEDLLYANPADAFVVAVKYGSPGSRRYERAVEQLAPEDVRDIFGIHWKEIPYEHHPKVIAEMERRGYYEEILEFMDNSRQHYGISGFIMFLEQFIQDRPADAFVFISERRKRLKNEVTGLPAALKNRLEECLHGTEQEAAEILRVYERIDEVHDHQAESDLKELLTEDALRAFPLRAELYQLCLERGDSFYWDIGKAMLDEDTIESFPDEARVLAYEAGEEELLEQIESGSLVPAYQSLIREAQDIVRLVGRQYSIDLPKRVEVGGPTGSYASIKTRSAGLPNATEGQGDAIQEETTNNDPGA